MGQEKQSCQTSLLVRVAPKLLQAPLCERHPQVALPSFLSECRVSEPCWANAAPLSHRNGRCPGHSVSTRVSRQRFLPNRSLHILRFNCLISASTMRIRCFQSLPCENRKHHTVGIWMHDNTHYCQLRYYTQMIQPHYCRLSHCHFFRFHYIFCPLFRAPHRYSISSSGPHLKFSLYPLHQNTSSPLVTVPVKKEAYCSLRYCSVHRYA